MTGKSHAITSGANLDVSGQVAPGPMQDQGRIDTSCPLVGLKLVC
jgi:hypothetical protein